jgi:hypothetical protein
MDGGPTAVSRSICAALACAVVCALAPAAQAQSLHDLLFGRKSPTLGRDFSTPPVARYVSEDGDSFVLDLSQDRPMLKFDSSPEVWTLDPKPAPRGDIIYKNDVGETLLRATRLGGFTIFTPHRPDGEAAALTGASAPIHLAALGPQALLDRLGAASLRASHAARHVILFDAEANPGSSAVIADAAMVASVAVMRVSDRPQGRGRLGGLRRVFLEEGKRVAAQLEKRTGTLKITVMPALGLAGRPSSDRIAIAMGAPER